MLAWIKSPRGSTMTATVVVVILALFWFAPWGKPLPMPLALPFGSTAPVAPEASTPMAAVPGATGTGPQASAPAAATGTGPDAPATGPVPSQAVAALPAGPARPDSVGKTLASSAPTGPEGTPTAADAGAPAFDIVRVEPSGDAVIAGRATPGSDVVLLDGDKTVAQVKVDASGQFALLPPALAEGSHYLTLQVRKPNAEPLNSGQGVAVTIAKAGTAKPLVALLSPDKATQILSDGSATAPTGGGGRDVKGAGVAAVAIQTVEAAPGGRFTASGVAHAGNQCRIYLNGAYLADVTAGKDGKWSVEIKKGMKPGRYSVRADELDAASGKVVNRAEVPFDYPVSVAEGEESLLPAARVPLGGAAPGQARPANATAVAMASAGTGVSSAQATASDGRSAATVTQTATATDGKGAAGAVIANLNTATVVHGDSLWRISRKMLGHGIKYTEIYASNVTQIRDPKLIYPGQIFVVPSKPTN